MLLPQGWQHHQSARRRHQSSRQHHQVARGVTHPHVSSTEPYGSVMAKRLLLNFCSKNQPKKNGDENWDGFCLSCIFKYRPNNPIITMSKTTEKAQQLIDEAIATRAKSLNLGCCGLTEIPEQVFEMDWLNELINCSAVNNNWQFQAICSIG
jgi:hypothetical protein